MTSMPLVVNELFEEESLALIEAYADFLVTAGLDRGLLGPREAPRIWDRHIINCSLVADHIAQGSTVVDIGSGAGLPGLPIAIRRPDLHVILLEPMLRRTTFLTEFIRTHGLTNVEVVRGRAEDPAIQKAIGEVDYVTSRAVAPLGKLASWSAPFARDNGQLIAMKGSSAEEECDRDADEVASVGWTDVRVEPVTHSSVESVTHLVMATLDASLRPEKKQLSRQNRQHNRRKNQQKKSQQQGSARGIAQVNNHKNRAQSGKRKKNGKPRTRSV